jgi:hypothetical protein
LTTVRVPEKVDPDLTVVVARIKLMQARVSGPLERWTGVLPAGQGPGPTGGPASFGRAGEVPAATVVLVGAVVRGAVCP